MRASDYIVDLGPGAGVHGGKVIAAGKAEDIAQAPLSLTGDYLSGRMVIEVPAVRNPPDAEQFIRLFQATGNNLKGIDLAIPVGLLTCVTGVSGSGKSTLINDTLLAVVQREINKSTVHAV